MARRVELIKRLTRAGLSSEMSDRYMATLRSFLTARMTKIDYEDAMLKILPRDKIHIHNEIIQELLHRAQQKRDGLPDLPALVPVRGKKVPTHIRNNYVKAPTNKESAKGAVGVKRKREPESDLSMMNGVADVITTNMKKKSRKSATTEQNGVITSPAAVIDMLANDKGTRTGKMSRERPASRIVKRPRVAAKGDRPSPTVPQQPSIRTRMPPPLASSSYKALPFFPAQPGLELDMELFLKLRDRVKGICRENGISSVHDDAIALIVHALEIRVKAVLEAGLSHRTVRTGDRAKAHLLCAPVRPLDIRELAVVNTRLLGGNPAMDLERLLLSLY